MKTCYAMLTRTVKCAMCMSNVYIDVHCTPFPRITLNWFNNGQKLYFRSTMKSVGAINDTEQKLSGQILRQVVDHLSPNPPGELQNPRKKMVSQLKVSIGF